MVSFVKQLAAFGALMEKNCCCTDSVQRDGEAILLGNVSVGKVCGAQNQH